MDDFVDLYLAILEHPREQLFAEVIEPVLPEAARWVERWEPLRSLSRSPPGSVEQEILWELFALSAIHDKLILPRMISGSEYRRFFEHLGFELRDFAVFDPLFHEISELRNGGEPGQGIRIGRRHWPTLMWGELVFARGGVGVMCHPSWGLIEGIADRTRLYFANDRLGRPCSDLSHGWGSNSRWGTSFHRFYRTARHSVFNADGEYDLATEGERVPEPDELPAHRRAELLMHRCLVSAPDPDPGPNHWPYDDILVLDASGPSWPLEPERVEDALTIRIGG